MPSVGSLERREGPYAQLLCAIRSSTSVNSIIASPAGVGGVRYLGALTTAIVRPCFSAIRYLSKVPWHVLYGSIPGLLSRASLDSYRDVVPRAVCTYRLVLVSPLISPTCSSPVIQYSHSPMSGQAGRRMHRWYRTNVPLCPAPVSLLSGRIPCQVLHLALLGCPFSVSNPDEHQASRSIRSLQTLLWPWPPPLFHSRIQNNTHATIHMPLGPPILDRPELN